MGDAGGKAVQEAVKDRSGFELGMGKMIELCEHCDDDVCDRCWAGFSLKLFTN